MPKYLDWYLVEIESQVRDRMRIDRVHTLLHETEQHLTEIYEENLAAGMSDEDAQLAALQRFGPVSQVSGSALLDRAADDGGRSSMWAVAMLVLAGLTTVGTVGFAYDLRLWSYSLFAIVGFVIAFIVFAYLGRRLLLFPIATVVVLTSLGVALVASERFVVETSLLPTRSAEAINQLKVQEAELVKELGLIDNAAAFFKLPSRKPPYALPNKQGFMVPIGFRDVRISLPVGYIVIVQRLAKGSVPDWQEAKSRWAERSVGWNRDQLQSSLNHVRSERNRLSSFVSQSYPNVLAERARESFAYGAGAFAGLAVLNFAAYGLGGLSRRRSRKTWLERRLA